MSEALKALIGAAVERPLTRDEAEAAFTILFEGDATPSQTGGLLMALRTRGETVAEYAAAAAVMRAKCDRQGDAANIDRHRLYRRRCGRAGGQTWQSQAQL